MMKRFMFCILIIFISLIQKNDINIKVFYRSRKIATNQDLKVLCIKCRIFILIMRKDIDGIKGDTY